MVETIEWTDEGVVLIDQTLLPLKERQVLLTDVHGVANAIQTMKIRGAPAIGVAAAMGLALVARQAATDDSMAFLQELEDARNQLAATRPTAVNLFWALDRMMRLARRTIDAGISVTVDRLVKEAQAIKAEDIKMCRAMGDHAVELFSEGATVLTHCNAGALATAGYGTALGVIRSAYREGRISRVFADETRPLLQGARLTAWELMQDEIPVTLITDNMAAFFMKEGRIDAVVTGADRIAGNGDVANKIGTYGVAVLAKYHGIPFYVAAPSSTFDLSLSSGREIPIERRHKDEVTHLFGIRIAPEGVEVENPAFDVTPVEMVTAIITERGILKPPTAEGIREMLGGG